MADNTARDVIYLAGCAVNERAPDRDRVAGMDLDALYALARRHLLCAAVAIALESAGCRDARFGEALAKAMRKRALFDREWDVIRRRLEAAGIWYAPLKGAVLKDLYPKYGMREFADHDILVDPGRAADVRGIMEGLGYRTQVFAVGIEDVYQKPPVLNFEMHTALFGPGHGEALCAYYADVETRLVADGWERRFSTEDLYLYVLAHEYKHYAGGGTGLRSLLDTYVLLKCATLDMAYVAAEAQKLGLADFEASNRALALRLFGGGEPTAAEREMLDYILASGTYGTVAHSVQNRLRRNGWGKLRYAAERLRVPVSRKTPAYAAFAAMYPRFYRHRILLPLLPAYRTLRAMRAGRFRSEARALRKA